ncbi:UDP-galactose transporter [Scheffersomyces spartinae]|uniref:UDP-galactose transporter homolog 1 n=1 Tax=Scheffersomyces spartinae TaxID=45513 RepID=A0A9P7V916_9ASCO|nr:UDP-galactose transporter [Scheffersomyces spartinae]KAG7193533.1 UDP-galactose transporter [Scheffersomyces spartinae]
MTRKHGGSALLLVGCVIGLYASFVSWSVLQERINTIPYGVDEYGKPIFFNASLVVNAAQALFAALIGLLYSLVAYQRNPFDVFTKNDGQTGNKLLRYFCLVALTSSISSPIGYQLMKHVDYLVYLLAKSCKLIPVMIVHTALYRTRFLLEKHVVALMVTAGVAVFTLAHSKKKQALSVDDNDPILGVFLLAVSMILDGLMNSTQDQIFKLQRTTKLEAKVTGATLMTVLNLLVFVLTAGYTILFNFNQIKYTVGFIHRYPEVLLNVVSFAALGAVGQVFVFIILEKFDSLVLVTATVTRKMISMILSVVLFGHYLNMRQWIGVALVFGGIGYEALLKILSTKSTTKMKKS